MIKSMTGYGNGSAEADGKMFTAELRAVNHRYSDFNIKCPRLYTFAEEAVRKRAAEVISRGKVDIFITVENTTSPVGAVRADTELAKSYFEGLKSIGRELGIPCEINASTFLRVPDVFVVEKAEENNEEILSAIIAALNGALEVFDRMRRAEGEKLYDDMNKRLGTIRAFTEEIEKRAPLVVEEYQQRLKTRMQQILEDIPYDEGRLLSEVAVFADKSDVNEEIVRLKSHLNQLEAMLLADEPAGRRLDFLIQEMNREINTTGSKSSDLEIARLVINVKAEIEKLREQCQNVE